MLVPMAAGPAAAVSSSISTLGPAAMGGNATNAIDDILRATPHALASFLAMLPAVEGYVCCLLMCGLCRLIAQGPESWFSFYRSDTGCGHCIIYMLTEQHTSGTDWKIRSSPEAIL